MSELINFVQTWTGGGKFAILFFPLFAILLLICALQIVKNSLVIISKSKFGAGFFGTFIIASVTSLPELLTEISQSSIGYPHNGLANDVGSNAFSTFLIACAALLLSHKLFLNTLSRGTKISVVISFIMSLVLTIFLFFVGHDYQLGSIGLFPLTLFLCYLISLYLSKHYGDPSLKNNNSPKATCSLAKAIVKFTLFASGVILFALLINISVSAFQQDLNVKSDSIGGIFLAIATSLPEVVVFFAALRKNESTVAITALTGSHFFNLGITFLGDLFYQGGPSFNKPEMAMQLPIAILSTILLSLLIVHFSLAKKFIIYKQNKFIYLSIPFIMIISYIVGWIFILVYN